MDLTLFETKGDTLTFEEMDNNFKSLRKGSFDPNAKWINEKENRVLGFTYTNTEEHIICVKVTCINTTGHVSFSLFSDEEQIDYTSSKSNGELLTASILIPPGGTFRCDNAVGSIYMWSEFKKQG